jgi:cytochrome c-type biogenesis protein CcmF
MISLIGFSGLLLSFLFAFTNVISFFFKNNKIYNLIFYVSLYLSFSFLLVSFLSLIYAYISSDFSNHNVFQNSHSTKPLLYKITGSWGNHEGSMLLWLLIMLFYSLMFSFNQILENQIKKLTIFFHSALYLCFATFVIFTSNPFLVNSIEVKDGLGLNPILQDPALAIHPPILYLGYVGFSLILSLALAGLVSNKIDYNWIITTKKWALFSWSMLSGGIALGSYWAYYELGWGGWWFWDPVENVSLMPWITGLALVHSLMMTQKEILLKRWIIFLSILCFSLSIFGTFLVRSGILTIVHTFASDSARGIFILILFLVITGFSFILFIVKSDKSDEKLNILFINKTAALVINNLLMLIACITILLGTIYPIIIEVITNKRISVGAPYFNSTALPILLPGFLLMSIAPVLSWQTNKIPKFKLYILVFVLMGLLTFVISYFSIFNTWGFIGIFLSLLIVAASLVSIGGNYLIFGYKNFLINNNALLAHIGVGIAILGITCSSIFQTELNESFKLNQKISFNDYSFELEDIKIFEKENYQELIASFIVSKNNKVLTKINPGKRYYHVSKIITTEAGIYHHWFKDIYIVLGSEKNQKWSVKIYQNPLVSFIWIGVILMIFSGLLGIVKK